MSSIRLNSAVRKCAEHSTDMDKATTKLGPPVEILEDGPEEDQRTFHFRKNHAILGMFIAWAILCLHTMVCLCPIFYGSSLWMSHLIFKLDEARGSLWLTAMEDTLSIFSSLSNDIHGHSALDERTVGSISTNEYTFDFASWCRSNHHVSSVVCYRGAGLDLITSFVTDFGTQLGEFGNSENPSQLGVHLANTYSKAINELDKVYVHTKKANETTNIDMDKLKLVHQLKKLHTFGHVMWLLKVIHGASFVALCGYKLSPIVKLPMFHKFGRSKLAIVVLAVSLITICQLCTFAIIITETVFAAILNSHIHPYDVGLVHGPAYVVFLLELGLGAIVTYHLVV